MDAALVHVRSDGRQQAIPLAKARVLIGRQDDCQIRVPSASVSRHHCELTSEGRALRIKDLGSANGTFVNGKRITAAELKPGDLLSVGPLMFVVRIDGKPDQIRPTDLVQRVDSGGPASPPKAHDARATAPATKAPSADSDDSSVDFDFDFSDDDDDQPAL